MTATATTETEHALIGALLLDPAQFGLVAGLVTGADFADPDIGQLFEAVTTCHESALPVGNLTVLVPELRRMGLPSAVTEAAFIARLLEAGRAGAAHVQYYAAEIARAARLRRLTTIGHALVARAGAADADPVAIAQWADSETAALGQDATHSCRPLANIADDFLRDLAEQDTAGRVVNTGLIAVDQAFGGWMGGELVVLAARTGIGKSALAMQIAAYQAHLGRPVLYVSLEMRDAELIGRILCGDAEVNSRRIRAGRHTTEDLDRLQFAADRHRADPLYVWAPPKATTGRIRAVAKRIAATAGLSLLVIDYVGLVRPADTRRQRHEQLGQITGDLKAMAKELAVPVLALAQLNREADHSAEPRLSQLRESGCIEQDADVVVLLHKTATDATDAKLIVAKHRHSTTGWKPLLWSPERMRFDCSQAVPPPSGADWIEL